MKVAPECENSENGFKSRLISRPSDIWSFGCIIAEVVTNMLRGAEGVKEFKQARKVKLGGVLITYTFHCGPKPNDGVHKWLEKLEAGATPIIVRLINLVRDLLQLKPTERPSAMLVTSRLRELALSYLFDAVSSLYQGFVHPNGSLELLVEWKRFELWGSALGLTAATFVQTTSQDAVLTDHTFSECINELRSIESNLLSKRSSHTLSHPNLLKLRISNDDLYGKLPNAVQQAIERRLDQQMIETEDVEKLNKIKQTFDGFSRYRSIDTLAAIRYMHELCLTSPIDASNELRLDDLTLQTDEQFPTFEIAKVIENGTAWENMVLVERIVYEGYWIGRVEDELYRRIGAIARFLHSTKDLTHLRVPECLGYFHEQKKHAFALIFKAPQLDEAGSRLVTLRDFIREITGQASKTAYN